MVDGEALKWQYFRPFDGLTTEEVNNLSITDLKKKRRGVHGENAWRVSDEIKQIIDDEPGPAGDFLKCFVTSRKEKQFFFLIQHI